MIKKELEKVIQILDKFYWNHGGLSNLLEEYVERYINAIRLNEGRKIN